MRALTGVVGLLLLGSSPHAVDAIAPTSCGGSFGWKVVRLPPAAGHPASFAEPGIARGPNGTLVVNTALANAGYPTWWFSHDNGKRWGPGRDLDPSGAMTGDADAAFGPDGSLYVLNLAFQNPPDQPTNPTVLLYRRPTGSRAWHGPATFPAPHGTDQPDRPWLAPDPHRPKRIFVTNSEGVGDVVMWTSTDRGHSFSGPTLITGSAHPADIVLTSRPLFDPARRDRMFMVYEASAVAQAETLAADARDFPLTQLWLARSDDGGRTWTNHLALDITAAFGPDATSGSLGHMIPASAIDESGNLYAAFSLRMGGAATQTHIYLLHSSDRGGHWSGPVRVDPRHLRSNVMPALAVGAPGRVDLSWYGSRNPDFTAPHARWAEQFAQSRNALSARPTFTRSRVSRGGPVHVGSIDSAGNPGSSQYDWDLRDFQGITIDGRGLAHIVWTNDGGRGATVAARQVSGPSLRCSPTGESLVPVR